MLHSLFRPTVLFAATLLLVASAVLTGCQDKIASPAPATESVSQVSERVADAGQTESMNDEA